MLFYWAHHCEIQYSAASFSRFYYQIYTILAERKATTVTVTVLAITFPRLCPLACFSRRKSRKSVHERFGSLNSPKLPTSFGAEARSLQFECRCRISLYVLFFSPPPTSCPPHIQPPRCATESYLFLGRCRRFFRFRSFRPFFQSRQFNMFAKEHVLRRHFQV